MERGYVNLRDFGIEMNEAENSLRYKNRVYEPVCADVYVNSWPQEWGTPVYAEAGSLVRWGSYGKPRWEQLEQETAFNFDADDCYLEVISFCEDGSGLRWVQKRGVYR